MRSLVLVITLAFALANVVFAGSASAQVPDAEPFANGSTGERLDGMPSAEMPPAEVPPAEESYGRASVLDRLFESLKTSEDADRAQPIERAIQSIWIRGESDTANLMLSWGMRAMSAQRHDEAIRYFSAAIAQEPEFMEAWNKRATAHFVAKDFPSSLEDIRVVLAMEPRHYGALAGLGMIMRQIGNDEAALAAFRAALDVNPHLEMPARAIRELEPKVEGRGI